MPRGNGYVLWGWKEGMPDAEILAGPATYYEIEQARERYRDEYRVRLQARKQRKPNLRPDPAYEGFLKDSTTAVMLPSGTVIFVETHHAPYDFITIRQDAPPLKITIPIPEDPFL